MEEKDYLISVNFTTTYEVEVRAKNEEEAKEYAGNDAYDMFCADWNTGEIDPTYFVMEVEKVE